MDRSEVVAEFIMIYSSKRNLKVEGVVAAGGMCCFFMGTHCSTAVATVG